LPTDSARPAGHATPATVGGNIPAIAGNRATNSSNGGAKSSNIPANSSNGGTKSSNILTKSSSPATTDGKNGSKSGKNAGKRLPTGGNGRFLDSCHPSAHPNGMKSFSLGLHSYPR